MKIYILLLLLLLIACVKTIEQNPVIEDEIITEKVNTTKEILPTKYRGVYGVFNFSEFKIEDCSDLIKHYNLVLAEEESRVNRRKSNVREARETFNMAQEEFKTVVIAGEETKINEFKDYLEKLNETITEKEESFKETREYFAKVRYSLRLIESECKRLAPN